MRVIAGLAKGHRLKSLDGRETRPTADRVKESLFNILLPLLEGTRFLDLFAGTGGIGIEALSRGAEYALFIDERQECIEIIKENLKHTKLYEKANVIKNDFLSALKILGKKEEKFDIIFVDPPYGKGIPDKALEEISAQGILNTGGIVIVEKAAKDNIERQFDGIMMKEVRKYGNTELVFYSLAENGKRT